MAEPVRVGVLISGRGSNLLALAEYRRRDPERTYAIALAGYMRLLSREFVERWRGRILNIHPSLLPLHKGLDTHRRALLAGDIEAGCSVHLVTPELDDGPVVAQARVRIHARDTPQSLEERVLAEEHKLYPLVLDAYAEALRAGQLEVAPLPLPQARIG